MTIKPHALILPLLFLAGPMVSIAASGNGLDYERQKGWFFYNEEVITEEVEPEELPPPPPPPPEIEPEEIAEVPAGPEPMSAAWVRENLPKYIDAAWDNPTPENMRAFMYLQRYAMDKSERFAEVAESVRIGDSNIDESVRRPTATFGSQKVDDIAAANRKKILADLASRAGIFFFFKADCQMCEAAQPILDMISRIHGFQYLAISSDGIPVPYLDEGAYRVDYGQADALNVTSYPALFLTTEDHRFGALGEAAVSVPDLERRILIVAQQMGLVSQEDVDSTRPILNLDKNFARSQDGQTLDGLTKPDNGDTIDPAELVYYLRQLNMGKQ
tara:strand:- start:4858 stop:5847 length:990 start_codon:yes stop_codon:yes gene_type:complete